MSAEEDAAPGGASGAAGEASAAPGGSEPVEHEQDAQSPALARAQQALAQVDEADLAQRADLLARVHDHLTEELEAIDEVARSVRPTGQAGPHGDGGT